MRRVLVWISLLCSLISTAAPAAQQLVKNGQQPKVCNGAVMAIDVTYSAGTCTLTQNITQVTIANGQWGGRPYHLDILNPGQQFTVSGWPSTVTGYMGLRTDNTWTSLRLIWSVAHGLCH